MKRVANSHGFTIVETMIVLAVTGLLLFTVALGWSGKQRASQYQTALADYRARIQQTVSDVQNGYFPSTANFTCIGLPSYLNFTRAYGGSKQGSNNSCVFLGKALQFGIGSSPEQWREYTVAGYSAATAITNAVPTLAPGLTETQTLGIDLQTKSITINGGSNYKGLLFLTDPGSYADGSLQSGNQVIRAYGMKGALSSTPELPDNATNGDTLGAANFNATPITNGAKICLKSTGTNHYGLITVAGDGGVVDVRAETVASC